MKRVLIVEDDLVYRQALGRALTRAGYTPHEVGGVQGALACLDGYEPTHAVVDLALPDGSGIDVVRAIVEAAPRCRVVLLTGHGTIPATVEAMRAGAVDVRTKPVSTHALVEALDTPRVETDAKVTLEAAADEHVQTVLDQVEGNVSEAARRLGVHRRTVQRWLQRRREDA